MRSLFLVAVLFLSSQAHAMLASCEYDTEDNILMVAESRGEKFTHKLEYSDSNNIGTRILTKLNCDFIALAVNELRASNYRYLQCEVRTNRGTNESHLTVEQPNAGRWIWSRGIVNVRRIDNMDAALPMLKLCGQVVRYFNTF